MGKILVNSITANIQDISYVYQHTYLNARSVSTCFGEYQLYTLKALSHISYYWQYNGYYMRLYSVFDVIEIYYIIRDNLYPTTLILSSQIRCYCLCYGTL